MDDVQNSQQETPDEPKPLEMCPHCGRKLLSMRSILCNWCGARIDDPAYLERAAQERAIADAKLREKVERESEETAQRGVLGRLIRRGKDNKSGSRTSIIDVASDN